MFEAKAGLWLHRSGQEDTVTPFVFQDSEGTCRNYAGSAAQLQVRRCSFVRQAGITCEFVCETLDQRPRLRTRVLYCGLSSHPASLWGFI